MSAKIDSTGKILRRFLLVLTLFFYAYAFAMPDRREMLSGLTAILMSPAQVTTDYFIIGNLSGTSLNMALTATACLALLYIPGVVIKGSTVVAFILAMGFTNLGYTQAVREYEKRNVIVYDRLATSIYSKRMLDSFGMDGAVRVSPLHCNTVEDIDRFLRVTQELACL